MKIGRAVSNETVLLKKTGVVVYPQVYYHHTYWAFLFRVGLPQDSFGRGSFYLNHFTLGFRFFETTVLEQQTHCTCKNQGYNVCYSVLQIFSF